MLMQHTLTQLNALKLDGMARAFEERVGMLVDRELAWRDTRSLERLLRAAKLKNPQACVEDIEYRQSRGLDPRIVASLAGCDWVRNAQNLILTEPTGAGKTWLACAFGQQACRQGFSVLYVRVTRLFEELKIAHGDGSFTRRLAQLAKTDVLILDDWGLQELGTILLPVRRTVYCCTRITTFKRLAHKNTDRPQKLDRVADIFEAALHAAIYNSAAS